MPVYLVLWKTQQTASTEGYVLSPVLASMYGKDASVYACSGKRLTLGTPAEVTGVQPERAVLHVAAAAAHGVDALVAQLGVGRRAPHLELPLLPVLGAPSARFAAFVPRVPRDTCFELGDRHAREVRQVRCLHLTVNADSVIGIA